MMIDEHITNQDCSNVSFVYISVYAMRASKYKVNTYWSLLCPCAYNMH